MCSIFGCLPVHPYGHLPEGSSRGADVLRLLGSLHFRPHNRRYLRLLDGSVRAHQCSPPGIPIFLFSPIYLHLPSFPASSRGTTLFETWELKYLSVSQLEIQRASLASIGSLVVMTIVWVYLARRSRFRLARSSARQQYRPFSGRLMWMVLGITLPVGIIAFIVLRGPILLGAGNPLSDDWATSSYVISLYQWFGISLLALIYYYGLRLVIAVPLSIYLFFGLLTFSARMMVIIPILFVLFAVLRRDSRSWRRPGFILAIVMTVLIFIPGKGFGPLLRQGDFVGARELLFGGLSDMRSGAHPDASFLDMTAVTMTQVDERGRFFYGSTYSGLLFLPVPRAFWPDKPGLIEWRKEIQTPWRPTGQMGTITDLHRGGICEFRLPRGFALCRPYLLCLHSYCIDGCFARLISPWSTSGRSVLMPFSSRSFETA